MQASDVHYQRNLSESYITMEATSTHQLEEDWLATQATSQHQSSADEPHFGEPNSSIYKHTSNQFVMVNLTPNSQDLEKAGKRKGEQDPWRNINSAVPRGQLHLLDFSGKKSKQPKGHIPVNVQTQSNKIELHGVATSERLTEALFSDDHFYSMPADEHELQIRQDPAIFNNSAYCITDCVEPLINTDLGDYDRYSTSAPQIDSEPSIFGMDLDQTAIGHDVEGSLPSLRYYSCCGKVTNCNTGLVIGWINDMVGKCDEHLYANSVDSVAAVQDSVESSFPQASSSEISISVPSFNGAGAHLAQQQLWVNTSIDRNMLGLCLSGQSGSPSLPSSTDSSLNTPFIPMSSSSESSATFLYPPTETFLKYPPTHDATFNDYDLLEPYSEESRIYSY